MLLRYGLGQKKLEEKLKWQLQRLHTDAINVLYEMFCLKNFKTDWVSQVVSFKSFCVRPDKIQLNRKNIQGKRKSSE